MAEVTLSFDNGPSPEVTPHVLDILKAWGLRASFVGRRLEEPGADDLLRRMRDEGHWIGNHTLSHRTPLGLLAGRGETEREIAEAQARLAGYAESELDGAPVADDLIAQEIAPCFVDAGGRRTDTVVLACTHYPLLLDRLERLSPWPVTFIDPAPAIARRAADLSGPKAGDAPGSPARIVFTSNRPPSAALGAALARFGLGG